MLYKLLYCVNLTRELHFLACLFGNIVILCVCVEKYIKVKGRF